MPVDNIVVQLPQERFSEETASAFYWTSTLQSHMQPVYSAVRNSTVSSYFTDLGAGLYARCVVDDGR